MATTPLHFPMASSLPSASTSSSQSLRRRSTKGSFRNLRTTLCAMNAQNKSKIPIPPFNPKDPFLSQLASAASNSPETFLHKPVKSDTPPYLDLFDSPKLMATPAQVSSLSFSLSLPSISVCIWWYICLCIWVSVCFCLGCFCMIWNDWAICVCGSVCVFWSQVDCICLEMIEIVYVVSEFVCVFCVCKWVMGFCLFWFWLLWYDMKWLNFICIWVCVFWSRLIVFALKWLKLCMLYLNMFVYFVYVSGCALVRKTELIQVEGSEKKVEEGVN